MIKRVLFLFFLLAFQAIPLAIAPTASAAPITCPDSVVVEKPDGSTVPDSEFCADHPFIASDDPFGDVCNDVPTTGPDASSVCSEKDNEKNPLTGTTGLLLRAARFLAIITGVASFIIILYGSIKYIVSGGESSSVESAKNTIMYALVGLVISMAAQGIIIFVINNIN